MDAFKTQRNSYADKETGCTMSSNCSWYVAGILKNLQEAPRKLKSKRDYLFKESFISVKIYKGLVLWVDTYSFCYVSLILFIFLFKISNCVSFRILWLCTKIYFLNFKFLVLYNSKIPTHCPIFVMMTLYL